MYGLYVCKYGFPWPVNPGPRSSFMAQKMRWIYYRPRHVDRNVVPYHPLILLLWGAHMNLQRVTSDAWSHYLLKYAFKCEPTGSLNLNPESAKSLGLHGLTDTQLRAVSAFCLSKPVSPCEAAMALMEMSIVDRSSTVVTVNSAPPECRSKIVLPSGPKSSVVVHPIDKYCARPASFETTTFYKYFEEFVLTKQEKKSQKPLGMDGFGNLIYTRGTSESLVRFSDFQPAHQIEGYFLNVLLQTVSFRFEADLLSPENATKSYFVECQLRGFIKDKADIEHHLQSYAERHLIASEQRQQLLNKIVQKHPLRASEFDPLNRQRPQSGPSSSVDLQSVADVLHSQAPPRPVASFTLNPEQQRIVDRILESPKGLYIISGALGCGKSYVLQYLHAFFSAKKKNVVPFASTGAAAARLGNGAMTAHRRFSIPARSMYLAPRYSGTYQHDVLLSADVFLGDEFSMMDCSLLDLIFFRLPQVTRK
jgi:hypothetical protein